MPGPARRGAARNSKDAPAGKSRKPATKRKRKPKVASVPRGDVTREWAEAERNRCTALILSLDDTLSNYVSDLAKGDDPGTAVKTALSLKAAMEASLEVALRALERLGKDAALTKEEQEQQEVLD